jgi:hypothetical protein
MISKGGRGSAAHLVRMEFGAKMKRLSFLGGYNRMEESVKTEPTNPTSALKVCGPDFFFLDVKIW